MDSTELLRRAPERTRVLIGASRATWSRWRRGLTRTPTAVKILLRIVINGELPQGGDDWKGWRFCDGRLCDPSGIEHTPGTIQAWHWTQQQLQTLRAQENHSLPGKLPDNVHALPAARRGHSITEELYRRIDPQSV